MYGPTRIAASAAPSRWPLVPAATGKLIIWTAKTKAATRPASGAVRSSSSLRAPRTLMATAAAATPDDRRRRDVDEAVGDVHEDVRRQVADRSDTTRQLGHQDPLDGRLPAISHQLQIVRNKGTVVGTARLPLGVGLGD